MSNPVQISDSAHAVLTTKIKQWSGWRDATLAFVPVAQGWASCQPNTHEFTADAERLVLNPNRLLRTVTPFRLRQEAVLTGCLLHEAGHARHTRWDSPTQMLTATGKPPSKQVMALAMLMEEARVEGCITYEQQSIGATDLAWTMRAAAANLLPMTTLSDDPDQALMQIITSWALRAGRQYAVWNAMGGSSYYTLPTWVHDFSKIVTKAIEAHLTEQMTPMPGPTARRVVGALRSMAEGEHHDDESLFMLDSAHEVIEILFPETDEPPMAGSSGCSAGDQDEEYPEEAEDAGESDDQGSVDPESGDEAGEPGDGEADGDGDSDQPGDGDSDQPGEGEGEGDQPAPSAAQQALAEMESMADKTTEEEAETEQASGGLTGGKGTGGDDLGGGFRNPTPAEREVQAGAERFLRDQVAPTESSKQVLTESPSASVDGAALAAWKAGGQVRDPRFFRRIRREVQPSIPIQVAVLVDVSSSMESLQKPSGLLSWALTAAALDLRNFAGRGVQVESTLIHWGDTARVIQRNGEPMPGIKKFGCHEGTDAMAEALALVEQEIPGFFTVPERPTNRLLVQFTDWDLYENPRSVAKPLSLGFEAGVNMLSVVPRSYSVRRSSLDEIMTCVRSIGRPQRGGSTLMKYDERRPEQVWDKAAEALS